MNRKHNTPVDILFVNPPSPDRFVYIRDINRHGRSSWERMIWPQTSLAYLASVAESVGLSVDLVDCIGEDISWSRYKEIVRVTKPRYVVGNIISVTFSNDVKALGLAKEIFGTKVIGMGPHLTAQPESSLKELKNIDFVIKNEAEATLKELLEVYEAARQGGDLTLERMMAVNGVCFVPSRLGLGDSDDPVTTEKREFIENLDDLPWPRHDLLPMDKYWAPFLGNYTFIEASRGCAYRCVFCRQAVMWEWKFRRRSGKDLAREALHVHSLGVNNILFHADTFTLSEEMVSELCEELIAAGSPFQWACNTHVRNLKGKRDLLEKMKNSGCWMIACGIESGDDDVLKQIKKQITVADAIEVVNDIAAAGIEPWGYFVLGLPGDTVESMEKSVDLALSLPLKMAKFDIAAPYPGTEFHRWASDNGYLRLETFEDFDQNASAVVEYPHLSRAEIKKAVRRATRRFYLQPKVFLRVVKEMLKPRTIRSIPLIVRDQVMLLAGLKRVRKDAVITMGRVKN